MKMMDFLKEETIEVNLRSHRKKDVLKELVNLLVATGDVKDKDMVMKSILDREKLGSTGVGNGVAIPHARTGAVRRLVGAFGCSRKGINFKALDGKPVFIFFLLLAPKDSAGPHLKALARISRLVGDEKFRKTLRKARSKEKVLEVIREGDRKKP